MTTVTRTRDDLIAEAFPLIAIAARKFHSLPVGINTDDLESAGNEALLEAATMWSPDTEVEWKAYAYSRLKGAMQNTITHARSRRRADLCPTNDDGETLAPPADPRSADPSEIAAARELVTRPRRSLSIRRLESTLPTPGAVADQVTKLRAAMFGAIDENAVSSMMQAVMAKAQAGDLKAAKLLMDLLAPGRSGVTVNQQAVVIQQGDVT